MSSLSLLLLLLLSAASSSSARPCTTIFFFFSSSSSSSSSTPLHPNPTPHTFTLFLTTPHHNPNPNPNRFFLIPRTRFFDSIDANHHLRPLSLHKPTYLPTGENSNHHLRHRSFEKHSYLPQVPREENSHHHLRQGSFEKHGYLHRVSREETSRTRDVMSVFGALLFGMGCGALTAATMYFVWSLFGASRARVEEVDEEEEEFRFDDDLEKTKKMAQGAYVAIPSEVVDAEREVKGVAE